MKKKTVTKQNYLSSIRSPEDFKSIPEEALEAVAEEIRHELVRVVTHNGGHLASNLGVVELTMAIHRVFDTPKDHVIFDVGHQSYVHKMLTGRYDRLDSLRMAGGLSGFTNRKESKHDCFGAGHSSTSLSAGLGFAISDKLTGTDAWTVVVVGDGAYTGGMIHEALNNCRKDLKLIIVMNENEMSISKNIGRFATNLARLRTRSGYFKTKRITVRVLRKIPLIGKPLYRFALGLKKSVKNVLYGSNYFESMGLTYLGPIDGNDEATVEHLLREAKKLNESVVVHLKTKKGKGYEPAEAQPDYYHGMAPSEACKQTGSPTFSDVMGQNLSAMAKEDSCICAVTAAMADGTGLCHFREAFPQRFFDVGIAEEHALTFCAGLAANGQYPCVSIYSTFLQRGYDNLIHDIALQGLPMMICVDRAGLNSTDGATHHGLFDVAFLSQIPEIRLYTPITNATLIAAMKEARQSRVPVAIRYPNGREDPKVLKTFYRDGFDGPLSARTNFDHQKPLDAVIVTHGRIVTEAMKAAEVLEKKGVQVGIVLLEILKPYRQTAEMLQSVLPPSLRALIFLEEEIRSGGMGMNLSDHLRRIVKEQCPRMEILATDDSFVETRCEGQDIYQSAGVSAEHICETIQNMLK